MHKAMQKHLNDLSRIYGGDVTDKYRFIVKSDDLSRRLYESTQDLKYPLLKESARDRFLIANSQGLEQQIEKLCAEALEEASEPFAQYLEQMAFDIFNGLSIGNATKQKGNFVVKTIAKALVMGVNEIVKQTVNSDNNRTH